MHPKEFEAKWDLTRSEMAILLSISKNTLNKWMSEKSDREIPAYVLKFLSLIDSLWEHWQELPAEAIDLFIVSRDREELRSRLERN